MEEHDSGCKLYQLSKCLEALAIWNKC